VVTVGVAAIMVAVNMIWVPAAQEGVQSAAIAALLAFLTSVYASYTLDRSRYARAVAEAGERASTAWRGAVIEAALDCIVAIDHDGKILEFNPAAERTFGHRRADVLGQSMGEILIPPALRDAHGKGLLRYQATGHGSMIGTRIDTTALRADGSKFPIELAITRVPQSEPAVFVGYLRDLTAQTHEARVSAALVRVGNEMMSLLDTADILDRLCVLTTDVLGCDCSDSFLWQPGADAYVWTAGYGRPPEARRVRPDVRVPRSAIAPLLSRMQRDEPVAVYRVAHGRGPSELLLHVGVSTALHMALCQGDQIIGVHTAAYHGRTELFSPQELRIARGIAQTASMALNNARLVEEVEQADHVKSEFLSTMSHELRTPVAALLGYAHTLEENELDAEERRHCVLRIQAVGSQLLELIESTLEIGRAEAGCDEVRPEPIRFGAFWRALGEQCAKMPRHPELEFEWNPEVPDVTVVTDRHKLSVALRNLISNAVKFTDRGGVRMEAQLGTDQIEFRVSDTGVGIAAQDHELIFQMFRQAGEADARHQGTGLGLYIVRRFVEQLGGRVTVHSELGHGSAFTITVPRLDAPAAVNVSDGDMHEAGAARLRSNVV
jgi:PAS domain S-box-containing protein